MNDVKRLMKKMPWKHRLIMILLSIVNLLISVLAYDVGMLGVKSFLFSQILLIASYYDIRTRIIPDWIHVLILLVGIIGFDPVKSIVGLIVAPLPFLIMALVKEGSIGGGDVKLIGAMGFVLGVKRCIVTVMLSNIFAILFGLSYYLDSKKFCKKRLPFVPFLYVGWMVVLGVI